MQQIVILGIETSCDETAAAVVSDGRAALSNIISSQVDTHRLFGGVVPEVASRKHSEAICAVVDEALGAAGLRFGQLDAVAVTYGPGLVGALLVGVSFAKALAFALKKPLVAVNHIEGHICANYLENGGQNRIKPPFAGLVASGGHTNIVWVSDYGGYEILGSTRDDAAGEAFDKVARALGLGYPGGPLLERLAATGCAQAIAFPKALANSYDFSFSGLKSAVLNYLNKCAMSGAPVNRADVAACFQKAVVEVLVEKTLAACAAKGAKRLALAGGVAANGALRAAMAGACLERGVELFVPPPVYCTDNAAMIAACGYHLFRKGVFAPLSLNADPGLEF